MDITFDRELGLRR